MSLRYLTVAVVCSLVAGCASLSRYDDHTYKSMTALKGEVKVFMADCSASGASGDKAVSALEGFRVRLSQAYEYEVGKANNTETTSQMKTLSKLFNEAYDRYAKNKVADGACIAKSDGEPVDLKTGCLSNGYCSGKSKVMESAFDIAISTEALKNK